MSAIKCTRQTTGADLDVAERTNNTHPHLNMSAQQGTQSPPPERQTGAQLQDPPANGQGVDKSLSKEALQAQLDVGTAATSRTSRSDLLTGHMAETRVQPQEPDGRRREGKVRQDSVQAIVLKWHERIAGERGRMWLPAGMAQLAQT